MLFKQLAEIYIILLNNKCVFMVLVNYKNPVSAGVIQYIAIWLHTKLQHWPKFVVITMTPAAVMVWARLRPSVFII